MDEEEFRLRGQEIIDYVVDYFDSVSQRRVIPDVEPGYLFPLLPKDPPQTGESFDQIMDDFEKYLMPGITHWQHPRFHAYFPASSSFPSILAEMMSDTISCVRYDWNISPAGKELEAIVLDWMGGMFGLPPEFLRYADGSRGGGIVQNSSSECIFLTMLTARNDAFKRLQEMNPSSCKAALLSSLVAYCSRESHSCVEKAATIAMVTIKVLDTDKDFRLRGEVLEQIVQEDKKNGLIPFYVSCNLGTTSCCSCDPIDELGAVCKANDMWLNVDGAYGGTSMVCPEYRYLLAGIEFASSFNVNPPKWMLVNIDCAVLFVKDRFKINDTAVYDKTLLAHGSSEEEWATASNRRMRAMKLWFVIRCYGVEGLQKHIRNHTRLAQVFEEFVRRDDRFEVIASMFGLVCFRILGSNTLNRHLLKRINDSAKLYIVACSLSEKYTLRFCVCSSIASEDDIIYAWSVIDDYATEILKSENPYAS